MQQRLVYCSHRAVWVLGAGLALGATGMAQVTVRPDAGALQQQIDRERQSAPLPRAGSLGLEGAARAPAVKDAATVEVNTFLFEGNTLLSSEELTQVLSETSSRRLNFAQLQRAAEKVTQAYRDAGWMAYVYLPEQDVTSGEVRLRIIEATMGELKLSGTFESRVSEERIRRMFQAEQIPGQALRIQALDRALLLVSDLPGIGIKAGLSEWSETKASRDVVAALSLTAGASGEATLDNAGSRSTGRERALATLNLNSPLGQGDRTTLTAMKSEGGSYVRAEVSWPLGYQGWRLSLYDAYLSYRIVAPEFLATQAKGVANTLGVAANYPVWRTPNHNLYANVFAEHKGFDNQANGSTESRYQNNLMGVTWSGNVTDDWGGQTNASLGWTHGYVDLNGSPNASRDAAGAQTAGRFDKWRYDLTRQQVLSSRVTGQLTFSGQRTDKNLDSSEKFITGGDVGVRAYPTGEGAAAQARLWSVEMRWRVTPQMTWAGFFDQGRVSLLRHWSGLGVNDYVLKGAGLAWMFEGPGGSRLRVSAARRIGTNPNPTSTGTDQDGSLIKNRYWMNLSIPWAF